MLTEQKDEATCGDVLWRYASSAHRYRSKPMCKRKEGRVGLADGKWGNRRLLRDDKLHFFVGVGAYVSFGIFQL